MKNIEIKKLKAKEFIALIKQLNYIPNLLEGLESFGKDGVIRSIIETLDKSFPDIVIIVSAYTALTPEEVESLELDELVSVIDRIIVDGQVFDTYARIKKVIARFQNQPTKTQAK